MVTEHLDYSVLTALKEVMEDEYPLLLETFLSDSAVRVDHLHQVRDAKVLGQAAHSFKGSSSNMGAVHLAELCRELEERATRGPFQGIEDLVNRIDDEFGTVRLLFEDERQRCAT
ncbi:Hpt domain-containing protein [Pseudomonas sp. KNUC1026]|nr:Hpt domain-containing protein [Pseudomonas sp. KNUC1026]UFH47996.1 Hpt domain-containing protein [Pseudomonas sp. KNUC1026]